MTRFQRYLSAEIHIEYKACLYFFAIGFYDCFFLVCQGKWEVSILHLTEMILMTYVMGYLQVYLLRNFDEQERFGRFEGLASLGCTLLYTGGSWFFGWFNHRIGVTAGFAVYVFFAYICMFAVNKIKRDVDTKQLNEELEQFKKKGVET